MLGFLTLASPERVGFRMGKNHLTEEQIAFALRPAVTAMKLPYGQVYQMTGIPFQDLDDQGRVIGIDIDNARVDIFQRLLLEQEQPHQLEGVAAWQGESSQLQSPTRCDVDYDIGW
jgi:hypothetical protein